MAGSNQPAVALQTTGAVSPPVVASNLQSLTLQAVDVASLCKAYTEQLFPLLDEGSRLLGRAQESKPGAIKLALAGDEVQSAIEKIEPFFENIDKSLAAIKTVRENFEIHFANAIKGTVEISKLEVAVEQTLLQAKTLVGEAHKLVGPPEKPLSLAEKKSNLAELSKDPKRIEALNQLHVTLEANAMKAKEL